MTVQMPLLPTATQTVAGAEAAAPSSGAAAEFIAVLNGVSTPALAPVVEEDTATVADDTLPEEVKLTADGETVVDVVDDLPDTPDTPKVDIPIKHPEMTKDEAPKASPELIPDVAPDQPQHPEEPEVPPAAPVVTFAPRAPQPPPRATDPIRSVDDLVPPDDADIAPELIPTDALPVEAPRTAATPVVPANALAAAATIRPLEKKPDIAKMVAPEMVKPAQAEVAAPAAPLVAVNDQTPAARAPIAAPIDSPAPAPKRAEPRRAAIERTSNIPAAPTPQTSSIPLPVTAAPMISPLAPTPVRDIPAVVDEAALPEAERLASDGLSSGSRVEQPGQTNLRNSVTAPPFVRQIAVNILDIGEGQTEIQLKPEELGRLRLSITSHNETSVTVMMAAERSETTDLLRRHVADLERDLMALGYTSIEFDFGNGAEADDTPDDTPMAERDTQFDGPVQTAPTRRVTLNSGLDIRL